MDVVLAVLAILAAGAWWCSPGRASGWSPSSSGASSCGSAGCTATPASPGLTLIGPAVDRLHKVNMQVVTMPVPAQEGITRDNVTVKVDAVVYFKVFDPVRVVVGVQNYQAAIAQVAQASLRSIIGKSELDDLLSNRERLNQGLELMLDSPAVDWGIHIDRVDIKDVALPEAMKRSMSRQAEAERERRSRVITAEGELQASEKLAQAAEVMAAHPAALQLRLLQTVVEVAAEKNSTLVLPFPVELLRFLERATPAEAAAAASRPDRRRPSRDPRRSDPQRTAQRALSAQQPPSRTGCRVAAEPHEPLGLGGRQRRRARDGRGRGRRGTEAPAPPPRPR